MKSFAMSGVVSSARSAITEGSPQTVYTPLPSWRNRRVTSEDGARVNVVRAAPPSPSDLLDGIVQTCPDVSVFLTFTPNTAPAEG